MKAKTVGEVIKNRPPAGVLDAALAAEYKVSNFLLRKCISHLDLISFCQNCVELEHKMIVEERANHDY